MKGGNPESSPIDSATESRDQKVKMEKQDMPNAKDEIRKLQEALKGEGDGSGSASGIMPKKTKADRRGFGKTNGIKPGRKPNEQPAERVVVQNPTQADAKEMNRERS